MRQVVVDFTADYKTTYMLYRLLRNNKESGPFSALQLKEMGLKPYDLLWTEGRGAAWQYASEITELKSFAPLVEEQPFERLYKRKENEQADMQPAVALKKIKPRYRISNGQLIMVEAGNMEVGTNGVIKETTPSVKEAAPIHQLNTTSVENKIADEADWQNIYPQWQPQQQKKETKQEEPVEIETKYSESLDDLKKRYAEKVLGDKKETSSLSLSSVSVKQNIMAVVAMVVLVAGGYIGYTLKKKDDASVTSGKPTVERADIAGNTSGNTQESLSDDNSSSEKTMAAENKSNEARNSANENKNAGLVAPAVSKSTTPVSSFVKESNNKTAVTAEPKTTTAVVKTSVTKNDKAAGKPAVTDSKTAANNTQQTNNVVAKNTAAVPSNAPVVPVVKPANKQITDYVSVKKLGGSGAGVQNIKLMVSNVSDFPIDLAVVDIQYFDSKGKYQKGETMYVKDINGGNNVEVRVPDSDKSSSIKYKVSMVQADQKTLYMVAD